jgi:hypothetical protein
VTFQTLQALGIFILAVGTIALIAKLVLLALALIDWKDSRTLPDDHPNRITTEEQILSIAMRCMWTSLTVVLGIAWQIAVYGLPDNAFVTISPIGWAFAVIVCTQTALSLAQAIVSLRYRSRVLKATAEYLAKRLGDPPARLVVDVQAIPTDAARPAGER